MHLRVPASSSRLNLRSALLPEDIFGRSLRASPPPYAAARGRPAADIRLAAGGEAGAQVAGAGDEDDETDTGDGMPELLAAHSARVGLLQRERVRSHGRGRQDPSSRTLPGRCTCRPNPGWSRTPTRCTGRQLSRWALGDDAAVRGHDGRTPSGQQ